MTKYMLNTSGMLGIFLAIILTGCWASKANITTENVTGPVLVGKVKTIGGEPIESVASNQKKKFSEVIENSYYAWNSIYFYGSTTKRAGSNAFDNHLLLLGIESSPISNSDFVIAEQIRFSVQSGYWFFVFKTANKGWLEGGIYKFYQD